MPRRRPTAGSAEGERVRNMCNGALAHPDDRRKFWSQYGQDHVLWSQHYSHRRSSPGLYMDIGTNHPEVISNTFFLDRCAGWSGLCVEPQQRYHTPILERRSCELLPLCVSDAPKHVNFVQAGDLGGIDRTNINFNRAVARKQSNRTLDKYQDRLVSAPSVPMKCLSVTQLLDRAGVTHVDVMNVDVEGHEIEVLRGVNFSRITVDAILAEKNRKPELKELLTPHGYRQLTPPQGHGELWVSQRIVWGAPAVSRSWWRSLF